MFTGLISSARVCQISRKFPISPACVTHSRGWAPNEFLSVSYSDVISRVWWMFSGRGEDTRAIYKMVITLTMSIRGRRAPGRHCRPLIYLYWELKTNTFLLFKSNPNNGSIYTSWTSLASPVIRQISSLDSDKVFHLCKLHENSIRDGSRGENCLSNFFCLWFMLRDLVLISAPELSDQ